MRSLIGHGFAAAFAACALLAPCAAAAFVTPDPTGLWYVPAESGWGLSITQQGDSAFVLIFVYDDARNPVWYFASDVKSAGTADSRSGQAIYSGVLYKGSGPPPSSGAPASAVFAAISVGSFSMHYGVDPTTLEVNYSVNGVSVTKTLQPQTWGDNRPMLVGNFSGGVLFAPLPVASTCMPPSGASNVRINGTVDAAGNVQLVWGTGIDTVCVIRGTYTQRGQLATIDGHYDCGPIGLDPLPSSGIAHVSQISVGQHGFAGQLLVVQPDGCTVSGRIGGVRVP